MRCSEMGNKQNRTQSRDYVSGSIQSLNAKERKQENDRRCEAHTFLRGMRKKNILNSFYINFRIHERHIRAHTHTPHDDSIM